MKLSNSSLTKYLQCPRSYKFHYKERLVSKFKGSALYFGGAFDLGCNELLMGKGLDKAKEVFIGSWATGYDNSNQIVQLKEYQYVTYSDSEFDMELLTTKDIEELEAYRTVVQVDGPTNILSFVYEFRNIKKAQGLNSMDPAMISYYNLINWTSLRNKGIMMLEAYNAQLLPKFKKVLEIQRQLKLDSGCGDTVEGIIDLVAELEDGSVALIDNKTSSVDYGPDSVRLSQQLAIYQLILNDMHRKGEIKYKVDKCGYAVIKKRPVKNKDKTCQSCGHKGLGTHKTCDNVIEGKRCNGEWTTVTSFSFETQFIVDTITEQHEDSILETINDVNKAVAAELFLPNYNSCISNFGKCSYFNRCHSNDTSEYIIAEERKNEQK